MKKLIKIVVFTLILFSCSQNKKQGSDINSREDELINQLFWQLVLPMPACDKSDSIMEGNEVYASEFYSMLESRPHQIYVQDTLFKPDNSIYETFEAPTDFETLITNLLSDSTVKPKKLNLKPDEISFDIKVITGFNEDSLHFERIESQNILALIKFSRVFFSPDQSKACMQISIMQNKTCYQSFICLADKQFDNWKLIRRLKLK